MAFPISPNDEPLERLAAPRRRRLAMASTGWCCRPGLVSPLRLRQGMAWRTPFRRGPSFRHVVSVSSDCRLR